LFTWSEKEKAVLLLPSRLSNFIRRIVWCSFILASWCTYIQFGFSKACGFTKIYVSYSLLQSSKLGQDLILN
jgi:hypothetical protein